MLVLVPLSVIGAPLAALLIRKNLYCWRPIAIVLTVAWLAVTLFLWMSPINEWGRSHRLEHLYRSLFATAPLVLFVGSAFSVGIVLVLGYRAVSADATSADGGTSVPR